MISSCSDLNWFPLFHQSTIFLVLIKIPLNHRLKFNWQLVALQLYIVYLILHRKVQTVQVYIALPWLHQVSSWVTCRATEPSYSRFQLLIVPIRSCLCRFQLRAGDLVTLLTEALRVWDSQVSTLQNACGPRMRTTVVVLCILSTGSYHVISTVIQLQLSRTFSSRTHSPFCFSLGIGMSGTYRSTS
jgi:hypothetical protein